MKQLKFMTGIFICFVIFCVNQTSAKTECVFGLENDPSPGSCGSYIDKDGNNLCDLSEVPLENRSGNLSNVPTLSEEELKAKTVKEVAEIYGIETGVFREELSKFLNIEVMGGDKMLDLHDKNGLCTGVAASIALKIKEGGGIVDVEANDLISGQEILLKKVSEVAEIYNIDGNNLANALSDFLGEKVMLTEKIQFYHDNYGLEAHAVKGIAAGLPKETKILNEITPTVNSSTSVPRYELLSIIITMLLLYLISYILVKEKKITLLTHGRIWNIILLLSFLFSAILGVLLVIRINWGWNMVLPFDMLYWHVEIGIVMAVATVFHIASHWRYYVQIVKRKN